MIDRLLHEIGLLKGEWLGLLGLEWRRSIAQSAVRTFHVAVPAPLFDCDPRLLEAIEDFLI